MLLYWLYCISGLKSSVLHQTRHHDSILSLYVSESGKRQAADHNIACVQIVQNISCTNVGLEEKHCEKRSSNTAKEHKGNLDEEKLKVIVGKTECKQPQQAETQNKHQHR